MRPSTILRLAAATAATTLAATLALPGLSGAAGDPVPAGHPSGPSEPVFVQTNDPTGNQVVVYERTPAGQLDQVGRYATGGRGTALSGAVVDDLASQGGLTYDAADGLLIAVNGGSATISVFRVVGPRLALLRVLPSGGAIPVSVTAGGGHIYVLDAGGAGTVQGYDAYSLAPVPGTSRSLGLEVGVTPQYLNTPGQIGLSPDGRQLIVTTKANGNDIDVFGVSRWGSLSATPRVNPSATPVPFGFTFDPSGHLVVTEAGTSNVSTYTLGSDGTIDERGTLSDGLAALCWIAGDAGRYYFGSNAGSATVTGYTIRPGGQPVELGTTATDPGPIDLVASPDGSSLYVETGGSDLVDSFSVTPGGTLVPTGVVAPELPGHHGLEGIAVG